MTTIENAIIIGAGPSGFTAAIYLARAGLSPLVLTGDTPGGALTTTTEVENFPGFTSGVQGGDLMESMEAQAESFGARVEYSTVTQVDLTGAVKTVTTEDGTMRRARAVILSTGSHHKHLGLPREQELTGRGISYCATCDGVFFRGQDIAVVGGGDTAAEEALFLARFASSVTMLVRGNEMRASKVMAERVRANTSISVRFNTEVTELHADASLTGITVRDRLTCASQELSITGLFIAIGHSPRSDLFASQVDVDADGYVLVEHPSTLTGLSGVFACGDLVDRHYRQAITAAGTGCAAALDTERFLS